MKNREQVNKSIIKNEIIREHVKIRLTHDNNKRTLRCFCHFCRIPGERITKSVRYKRAGKVQIRKAKENIDIGFKKEAEK